MPTGLDRASVTDNSTSPSAGPAEPGQDAAAHSRRHAHTQNGATTTGAITTPRIAAHRDPLGRRA
jgi:hypothetical protein